MNLIALVSRFQTTCCSRVGIAGDRAGARIEDLAQANPLGFGRRPDRVDGRIDHAGQIGPLHVEPHLAGDDAAHVEQVLDELRLGARVALDRVEALLQVLGVARPGRQQLRPAEDGVERRAQLVRQGGQKLVLQPAGAVRPRLGPRARFRAAPPARSRTSLRPVMSRAIFEAPMIRPRASLIGETVSETLIRCRPLRTRTVS